MTEIGAFEAKNSLGSLLDRVERGEEIVITRHGKPVARLVPLTYRTVIDRMLAEGSAWPATEDPDLLWQYEAPPAQPDEPSVAEVLDELRRERI